MKSWSVLHGAKKSCRVEPGNEANIHQYQYVFCCKINKDFSAGKAADNEEFHREIHKIANSYVLGPGAYLLLYVIIVSNSTTK